MKKLNEEEFQRLLEQQLKADGEQVLSPGDKDAALYRLLFDALAQAPDTINKIDLAEAVVKQIKINEQKAENLRYNMIIASVLIVGILFAYFSIRFISPDVSKSALNFILVYKWVFIFIIFCFGLIEIADKNLVKRKLSGG